MEHARDIRTIRRDRRRQLFAAVALTTIVATAGQTSVDRSPVRTVAPPSVEARPS